VDHDVTIFGIRLLGVSEATLTKAILTIVLAFGILLVRWVLSKLVRRAMRRKPDRVRSFWIRQFANLFTAAFFLLALLSIWFDDPTRLAGAVGLVAAGLAFALQKVVTSFAGYIVIMRSRVFTVGDRIVMGGVRGDVISLGFLKTTMMEMGDPTSAAPYIWVHGRQFTGRIVTVTNDKIFEEPVFNSTREFPFIWDEITVPITYATDRKLAETIMLAAAERATSGMQKDAERFRVNMNDRYHLDLETLAPRVFWRITDNWLELSLRFIVDDHKSRAVRDQIAREILENFDAHGMGIASTTIDIVAFPPMRRAEEKKVARP
jgi:small-conductance mechanosensitive channel